MDAFEKKTSLTAMQAKTAVGAVVLGREGGACMVEDGIRKK